jgi:hypothetical protein
MCDHLSLACRLISPLIADEVGKQKLYTEKNSISGN